MYKKFIIGYQYVRKIFIKLLGKIFFDNKINRYLIYRLGSNKVTKDNAKVSVNLIGYYNKILGTAEFGRNFTRLIINDDNININIIPIALSAMKSIANEEIEDLSGYFSLKASTYENIFFIGADQISKVYNRNKGLFANHYNRAVYWWEFEDGFCLPRAFDYIDEILVFTTFIYNALSKVVPVKVKIRKMTYPLIIYQDKVLPKLDARDKFGINRYHFVVMFSFDLNSSIFRKNPYAVIDTFKSSIARYDDTCLVLKISGANNFPKQLCQLYDYLTHHEIINKVLIITHSLTTVDMQSLLNSCDIYLSLHTAEGLGMGMLEAMALGKAVVATNYGGNTDFMNQNNSILIDYTLTTMQHNFGPYTSGLKCAEPNINQASDAISSLYHDPKRLSILGEIAKSSVGNQYSVSKFKQDFYSLFGVK